MDTHEINGVVDTLKRYGNGDAWLVTTFGFVRTTKTRSEHMVTVEVHEHIGDSPRFSIVATDDETGKQASGNSNDSVQTALATVHWGDLDK